MPTVFDLLNPDSTEVEAQRIIRVPGATTGDVLTVQADKTVAPAPGGASQPVTAREFLAGGGSILIPDGSDANLPMVTDPSPGSSSLLDFTDPTAPTVLEGGVYAITIEANCDDGTQAAGSFNVIMFVGGPVVTHRSTATSSFPLNAAYGPSGTVTLVVYLYAGDPITVKVANTVGDATALHFGVSVGVVQRLSLAAA